MPAPTHRIRSKSAPRGRSPDPRALKKAAARAKASSKAAAKGDPSYVTPPPRNKKGSPASSSRGDKNKQLARKISFGNNTEHKILAEHDPPKDMKLSEADEILKSIKDPREQKQFVLNPILMSPSIVCHHLYFHP